MTRLKMHSLLVVLFVSGVLCHPISPGAKEFSDVALSGAQERALLMGLRDSVQRWPAAAVPYRIRVEDFDEDALLLVALSIPLFNADSSCVTYRRADETDADYVLITGEKSGCWSHVGRTGGMQQLNLQTDGEEKCLERDTILHLLSVAAGSYNLEGISSNEDSEEPDDSLNFISDNNSKDDGFGTLDDDDIFQDLSEDDDILPDNDDNENGEDSVDFWDSPMDDDFGYDNSFDDNDLNSDVLFNNDNDIVDNDNTNDENNFNDNVDPLFNYDDNLLNNDVNNDNMDDYNNNNNDENNFNDNVDPFFNYDNNLDGYDVNNDNNLDGYDDNYNNKNDDEYNNNDNVDPFFNNDNWLNNDVNNDNDLGGYDDNYNNNNDDDEYNYNDNVDPFFSYDDDLLNNDVNNNNYFENSAKNNNGNYDTDIYSSDWNKNKDTYQPYVYRLKRSVSFQDSPADTFMTLNDDETVNQQAESQRQRQLLDKVRLSELYGCL